MRKIQTAIWFLCSLLIGISLGTIAVRTYESYSFKPWEWNEPPIILNCYKEDLNSLYIIEPHFSFYWGDAVFLEQQTKLFIDFLSYFHWR